MDRRPTQGRQVFVNVMRGKFDASLMLHIGSQARIRLLLCIRSKRLRGTVVTRRSRHKNKKLESNNMFAQFSLDKYPASSSILVVV